MPASAEVNNWKFWSQVYFGDTQNLEFCICRHTTNALTWSPVKRSSSSSWGISSFARMPRCRPQPWRLLTLYISPTFLPVHSSDRWVEMRYQKSNSSRNTHWLHLLTGHFWIVPTQKCRCSRCSACWAAPRIQDPQLRGPGTNGDVPQPHHSLQEPLTWVLHAILLLWLRLWLLGRVTRLLVLLVHLAWGQRTRLVASWYLSYIIKIRCTTS